MEFIYTFISKVLFLRFVSINCLLYIYIVKTYIYITVYIILISIMFSDEKVPQNHYKSPNKCTIGLIFSSKSNAIVI